MQPRAMPAVDLLMRRPIRRPHGIGGLVEKSPVVIAADVDIFGRHQRIGGRRSLQWTRQMIAEIHHQIGRLRAQIGLHSFECSQISMNISNNGNTHGYE